MEQKIIGNIIRVGKKDMKEYVYPIILTMQPEVYDNYQEIIIEVTLNNLYKVETLLKLFKSAGLEESDRILKELDGTDENGLSYKLPKGYQITLKKHPALRH